MNRNRNNIILFLIEISFLYYATACSSNSHEPDIIKLSPKISIEIETPKFEGWSINENIGTRNAVNNCKKHEKDGLDMEINNRVESDYILMNKANTRWSNIDNNTVFRVLAYECINATSISTTNYKGYGDYKLLTNGTIETIKPLIIPIGTYTFVCYSYGDANPIATFNNSTASIAVSHGKNFMTCIKPNIKINISGSKYILSNILFKRRCVRYRVIITAEKGRMANITACSGTLTLPSNSATFSFTNDEFIRNSTAGTVNLKWNNPNAMSVASDYIYILPQTSNSITITLNPTIGGKIFTDKSITLPSVRFNRAEIYNTKISFTTTEGYIVGGAFWAKGNLYYSNGSFAFYATTTECSTNRSQDFWRWDALYPSDAFGNSSTTWNPARDPCRKISNWRLPTMQEFHSLIQVSSTYTTMNGKKGVKFSNILFLPCTGYFPGATPNLLGNPDRGLYWSQNRVDDFNYGIGFDYGIMLDFDFRGIYAPRLNGSDKKDNGWPIRCVRAD